VLGEIEVAVEAAVEGDSARTLLTVGADECV
jgi:hypothetical protein